MPRTFAERVRLVTLMAAMCACALPASAHLDPELQAHHVGEHLEKNPEEAPELYLRRGVLHAKSQRWSVAIGDFDRALEIAPDLHQARLRKADALLSGGCHQQAMLEAELFLEYHPGHPQALIIWARATSELGAPDKALVALESALFQLEQPSPMLYLELAQMVLRADSAAIDRALWGLEEGMRRVGPISTLVLEAVTLERRAGRPREALARLEELRERTGVNPRWMLLETELLEELGHHTRALSVCRRALAWIATLPNSRRSSAAIGRIREKLSQRLELLTQVSRAGAIE